MHLVDAGGDNIAKIPFAVVPVGAGTGEKVTEIGPRLIPHPHPAVGQPVMREMQPREQGWLIAGIQRCHKAIENRERLGYRRRVRLGLSLVDRDRPSPLGGYFSQAVLHGKSYLIAVRKMHR